MTDRRKLVAVGVALVALVAIAVTAVHAVTVTNRGEVITVPLLSENPEGSTTVTGPFDGKVKVARFTYDAAQQPTAAGTIDLVGESIPAGSLIIGPAFELVETAVAPANTYNLQREDNTAITGEGLTATGADALTGTGVVGEVLTVAQGYELVATNAITAGKFSVFVPYIQGYYIDDTVDNR